MGGKNRKYKFLSIEKINEDRRWHIGAFLCRDYEQFYLMLALWKWDVYIGKVIDWDSVW